MSDKIKLCAEISSTDTSVPLGFEAWLDDVKFYDTDWVSDTTSIEHELSDEEAEHQLKFVLKNKLPDHTILDDDGNIVKDALINVDFLEIDGIDITSVLNEKSIYVHNFNGNGAETTEKFTGVAGCNGSVTLKFATPLYLWLLENM